MIDGYLMGGPGETLGETERAMREFENRLKHESGSSSKREQKRPKFDYSAFKREVESGDWRPEVIYFDTLGKAKLLEIFGVDTVKYDGRSVSIYKAEPHIIGGVFKSRYETSKKRNNQ